MTHPERGKLRVTHSEHEKLRGVADRTQAVGEFLDWVAETHHCELGRPEGHRAEFRPIGIGVQQLLAQWTGVDLDRLEQEKRAMLDDLRRRQDSGMRYRCSATTARHYQCSKAALPRSRWCKIHQPK